MSANHSINMKYWLISRLAGGTNVECANCSGAIVATNACTIMIVNTYNSCHRKELLARKNQQQALTIASFRLTEDD